MHEPRGASRLYCPINQNEPGLATDSSLWRGARNEIDRLLTITHHENPRPWSCASFKDGTWIISRRYEFPDFSSFLLDEYFFIPGIVWDYRLIRRLIWWIVKRQAFTIHRRFTLICLTFREYFFSNFIKMHVFWNIYTFMNRNSYSKCSWSSTIWRFFLKYNFYFVVWSKALTNR